MQHEFLEHQRGLICRYVWQGEEGKIGALLLWESDKAAHLAMENAAVRRFVSLILPGTYQMNLSPLVQHFSAINLRE